MKLLSYEDLRALGIPYSKTHIWRLIQQGQFPKPVKMGRGKQALNTWIDDEIHGLIASRTRARDEAGAVNGVNTWDEDEYHAHLAQRKAARGP